MKYVIEDTTLNAIGDAVRAKGNTEDKILVSNLATAINNLPSGGDIEVEPIVLTGDCSYACGGDIASTYIDLFGNTISTNNVTSTNYLFQRNTLSKIPFDINWSNSTYGSMAYTFNYAENLKELPKINNAYPSTLSTMFGNCTSLREIPEDWCDTWNWERMHTYSSASMGSMFSYCSSLRKIPNTLLSNLWGMGTSGFYTMYSRGFNYCCNLDGVIGIPIHPANLTSNCFDNIVGFCIRLKDFIFQTNEDGTPKVAKWKNQTLDFSYYTGYAAVGNRYYFIQYNSGITADKEVKDDATYQALKDDPDWFTCDINYSRYNHDSAVATINSLPDCSATGTNTIKFSGNAGAKTDGGAINTLTEEEIAVAAAKGWTVTLV